MKSRTIVPILLLMLCGAPPMATAGQKTLAWERCKKNATAAMVQQAAREGRPESYYTGANGGGLATRIEEACGLKPSLRTLPADERRILDDACRMTTFADLSRAASSWFERYGENSEHWQLASRTCDAIYEAQRGGREEESRAILASTPTAFSQWLELCATTGRLATRAVELREIGAPLTTVLQLTSSVTDEATRRLIRDITVEIYDKRYWSAAVARQVIETRCMLQAPREH